MAYKAVKSPDFMQDVDEIVGYIARTLASPSAAASLFDGLDREVALLEEQPKTRPLSRDSFLAARGYRKSVMGNYLMLYRVDDEKKLVLLVHLFYGGRDYARYV